MNPLGTYRPGSSWLHRLAPGPKLIALATLSVVAMIWRSPTTTTVLLVSVAVGFITARVGLGAALRAVRRLLVVIVLVGGYQTWQRGWEIAYTVVGNVVGLVVAAALFSTVTPTDAVLDTIVRALRPLRRLGVRTESVALAFSLLIRAIPATLDTGRDARQAALARGLDRSPRAHLVPLAIRSVARARMTGDAIYARGLVDDESADG